MVRDLRARAVVASLAVLPLVACGSPAESPAEGHLLIAIDTDAPLPSSSGGSVGVFDSVHLEVLDPDGQPACGDCVREIGLSQEQLERGATFVVRSRASALLRARLFASRLGVAALDDAVVIERWVRLPASPAEGEERVTVTLPLEHVGLPLGSLTEPTSPDEPEARLAPQPAEPATTTTSPGEVCVEGGWFWMGDPRLPFDGERSANVPRLSHVAPFCVDDHEITVGELRASQVDTAAVVKWSGHRATSDLASFCAFTNAPGPNDERAVNCVPWETARAACRVRGMDLPTEAQLEYLGTAFGRSTFVWGQEQPTCDEAFVGRAVAPIPGDGTCAPGARLAILPTTAVELGAMRDVLQAPGGAITGLASNVTEWTRESFEPRTAACRGAAGGPVRDPECPATTATKRIAVRGGNLVSTVDGVAAALRAFVPVRDLRIDLGFRCVR
jgi:formylglycine-generating enzyme required for sulfatase activity